jgi:hypothetical protein
MSNPPRSTLRVQPSSFHPLPSTLRQPDLSRAHPRLQEGYPEAPASNPTAPGGPLGRFRWYTIPPRRQKANLPGAPADGAAAWADIRLTKRNATDRGIDLLVDALRFEIEDDCFPKPSPHAPLHVVVLDDLLPLVQIHRADEVGEPKDLRGGFGRTFLKADRIALSAPPRHG